MKYCKSILAILAIVYITSTLAGEYPQLHVFHQFGQVETNFLKRRYDYLMNNSGPRKFQAALDIKKENVTENVENIIHDFNIKYGKSKKDIIDLEKCKKSFFRAANWTRYQVMSELERCERKYTPDRMTWDAGFQKTIALGEDFEAFLLKSVHFCDFQYDMSTEDCSHLKIRQADKLLSDYREESSKFRENLANAIESASASMIDCYSKLLANFMNDISTAKQNGDNCLGL